VITIQLSEERLNDHLAADHISLFKVITIWPSEEWFNDHPAADQISLFKVITIRFFM
jgi:hypothetical protein